MPPHKRGRRLLPIEDRLRLLEAAIADEEKFALDAREARSGTPCYTFDTLSEVQAEVQAEFGGEADVLFLIGGDSLRDLPKWYRAEELVRAFTLVTIPRDPATSRDALLQPVAAAFPSDLVLKLGRFILPVKPLPISSTEIRRRAHEGLPLDGLVPPVVARLIAERGYYR